MRKYLLAVIIPTISMYIVFLLSCHFRKEVVIGGEFLIPIFAFLLWLIKQQMKKEKQRQRHYEKSRAA